MKNCTHQQGLLTCFLLFLLLLSISACENPCYDERDYKAKYANMQSQGIKLCNNKGMKHLSTNLVSIEDDWLISCYTSSPPKTYGFRVKG